MKAQSKKNNHASAAVSEQALLSAGADQKLAYSTMETFLKSIERRAFQMTRMATGDRESALDIVQETMYKLVEKYSAKPAQQWKPLFYRILNSKLTDYYRRKAVRDRLLVWPKPQAEEQESSGQSGDYNDWAVGPSSEMPDNMLLRAQRIKTLAAAIKKLSGRQQQAFMLRCWEGMSTLEAADIMKCSTGSVKTHYSRAMQSLRGLLEAYNHE